MNAEEVAKAFAEHYYNMFDSNVESLAPLFVSCSTVKVTLVQKIT